MPVEDRMSQRFDEMKQLPTPCYVVDEAKIEQNLEILRGVMDRTGARILLAQKAFSMYALYPLIGEYLSGATASGLYEARLGMEEMDSSLENHVFSRGFSSAHFLGGDAHIDPVIVFGT